MPWIAGGDRGEGASLLVPRDNHSVCQACQVMKELTWIFAMDFELDATIIWSLLVRHF